MIVALLCRLDEAPNLYLDEMAWYIYDSFGVVVSPRTIATELRVAGWSRKLARRVALERSQEDRNQYWANISQFTVEQLVFVDESGADSKTGIRKSAWAPVGTTPILHTPYNPGEQRLNILPAYTVDGVLVSSIYSGSTNAEGYDYWIEHYLLPCCNPYPAPRSVVVMDNASFHHSGRIKSLFAERGVVLVYLPAYSPDLNPIEEFFGELKEYIRRHFGLWRSEPELWGNEFKDFLQWCVDTVGRRSNNARAHFGHSGYI